MSSLQIVIVELLDNIGFGKILNTIFCVAPSHPLAKLVMVSGISTAKAKSWSNSPWILPVPVTDPV